MRLKVNLREDRRIEDTLARLPLDMQQKTAKKMVRGAGRVFRKEAKSQALRVTLEPREYEQTWGDTGKQPSGELHQSIKTSARIDDTKVIARTRTTGLANLYAASVEFGHIMYIFGRYFFGRRVEQHAFWRPAQDLTRGAIHQTMVNIGRRELKRLAKD